MRSNDVVAVTEPNRPDAAEAVSPEEAGTRPDRRRQLMVAGIIAASAVVLFVAYVAEARTTPTLLPGPPLQAWDMLHGNLLLHGWTLSDVSFYTTELPEYMLVETVRGLSGDVINVAAAFTYTLVVLLAAFVAKGRATGREGLVRALVAAGILIAPQRGAGTGLVGMLSGPDHIGTHVPLLITWLVLDRARPRWWVPATIGLLLAWAGVADTLVFYEGVLPIVVVCAVRMYRRRGPIRGNWYELSLAAAALISAVVAKAVLLAIRHAGGFYSPAPRAAFAQPWEIAIAIWSKFAFTLQALGANFFGEPVHSAAVPLIHLAGVALVAAAVVIGVKRFYRDDDILVQVLTAAIVLLLAAYFLGTKGDANEILGVAPIGAVLAGRLLAGRLLRSNMMPVLVALAVAYVAILGYNATRPVFRERVTPSAAWFEAHHLKYGLAGYWLASNATINTGNRIQIRPARMYNGMVVVTASESDASWYDPAKHYANFAVASAPGCTSLCVSAAALRAQFGKPSVIYQVGRLQVMVWRQNLLSSLPTYYWCSGNWAWTATARPSLRPCG